MSSQRSEARPDAERAVWRAMRELVLERGERRPEVAQALGMSFVRIKALRFLADGPLTQQDLCGRLQSDKPYTSIVVGELEDNGYVKRTPDPDDARRRIVALTAKGRRAAAKATEILERPPAWLAGLDADQLQQLAAVLGQGLFSDDSQRL